MNDTAFLVPKDKLGRLAEALPVDASTGKPNKLYDVTAVPNNDSGGAGGVSTAADYLRFAQMMANGGQLDGKRYLSRSYVALMTSDHLGTRIQAQSPVTPGEILLGTPGYTFGLGFAVRQGRGRGRCTRLRGRVHVGRLRRHLLLDRSEGTDRRACT